MGHRYYDAYQGRFISEDPARDEMNRYAYCGNNPLVATDPSGLEVQMSGSGFKEQAAQQAAYDSAKAYITNNGKDKESTAAFATIESDKTPMVTMNIGTGVQADLSTASTVGGTAYFGGSIDWNPQSAMATVEKNPKTGKEKETGSQSPAMGLYHEVCHMAGALKGQQTAGKDPQYDTKEERRVLTGPERRSATRPGETGRNNHLGRTYHVSGPTVRR